jgi:hypothetical protein
VGATYSVHCTSPHVQWLRLALSNGPNRVDWSTWTSEGLRYGKIHWNEGSVQKAPTFEDHGHIQLQARALCTSVMCYNEHRDLFFVAQFPYNYQSTTLSPSHLEHVSRQLQTCRLYVIFVSSSEWQASCLLHIYHPGGHHLIAVFERRPTTVAMLRHVLSSAPQIMGSWIRISLRARMLCPRLFCACVVLCRQRPCDGPNPVLPIFYTIHNSRS